MIALVSGYKVAPKRYKTFLSNIHIDPTDVNDVKQILTHSVRLVKALLFCQEHQVIPQIIVAMDPPDLRVEAINARMPTLDPELQKLYLTFMAKNPHKPEASQMLLRMMRISMV